MGQRKVPETSGTRTPENSLLSDGYQTLVQSVGEPMVTKQKQNPHPHKPTYRVNWGYSKRERQNKAIAVWA